MNTTKKSSGNRPDLTLDMNEKIYLAVAKRDDLDKLAFVYTLACLKAKVAGTFNLIATPEIHAFKNPESAELYYQTISQIIEVNGNDKAKAPFFDANDNLIMSFLENTEGSKVR